MAEYRSPKRLTPFRSEILFLYVPCPNKKTADSLAKIVVNEGLCACANIFPEVNSIYHWDGKVEESKEVVMILKTTSAKVTALESRLRDLHPYTTPCFAQINIDGLNREYAQWLVSALMTTDRHNP